MVVVVVMMVEQEVSDKGIGLCSWIRGGSMRV